MEVKLVSLFRNINIVKSGGSEAYFVFLTTPYNNILFLRESKNGNWDEAIKNCSFGGHPAVLAKFNLLANKSIYWPRRHLASESEQSKSSPLEDQHQGLSARTATTSLFYAVTIEVKSSAFYC